MAISLNDISIDFACALRFPAVQASRSKLIPFCIWNEKVYVACLASPDSSTKRLLQNLYNLALEFIKVDSDSLDESLNNIYGKAQNQKFAGNKNTQDPNVNLGENILNSAMLQNISDIHINPNTNGLAINFRIDGLIESFQALDQSQQAALISRFKVMCGMNIAEKRAPQDGQFNYFSDKLGRGVDIRVASIPTKYGEKLTLRLLDMGPQKLTLSKIGMLPADLQTFRHAIKQPQGIILLTGPTGSGKSTTLYGGLRELTALQGLNIITIEDPVEYDLDGVTQVAVDGSEKVTFAKALRSVLRHDPDVVMIGEIRDAETASIAIKASITGHLVLSTLHTNSAPSVITRLIDMGVERYLVAATLRLAIAQRLVRKLCSHCRKESKLKKDQAILLKNILVPGSKVYTAKGCFYCNGKGYKGRVGLFEILNVDHTLSTHINEGVSENEIMEYMKENKQKTLLQDAAEKVTQGICSVEEVLRVISVN